MLWLAIKLVDASGSLVTGLVVFRASQAAMQRRSYLRARRSKRAVETSEAGIETPGGAAWTATRPPQRGGS